MAASDPVITIHPDTFSYIRSISASLMLLMHANTDKTQTEVALRRIIEDTTNELERLGIEDKSHSRLPDSGE